MRTLFLMVAVMFALLLFLPSSAVLAHPCDDNYMEQQAQEDCWWRYWNDLSNDEDMMSNNDMMSDMDMSTYVPTDGTRCNTEYTEQQAKEDCWWRYWNSLPEDMNMMSDMNMTSEKDMMSDNDMM